MAGSCWRIATGLLLVPVAVGSLAGCGGGSGQSAAGASPSGTTASDGGFTATKLQGALLTRVNGVAAAAPATSGKYAALTGANGAKQAANAAKVTPKACVGAATVGFDPGTLADAPAAAVTFQIGTNGVSEVLIASPAQSASTALASQIPAECARYQETFGGKTYTYTAKEQAISGIGEQARLLNVHAASGQLGELWSLIYRGAGFVGTVTVAGPNASEQAVKELGQQAYAFAAKSLS